MRFSISNKFRLSSERTSILIGCVGSANEKPSELWSVIVWHLKRISSRLATRGKRTSEKKKPVRSVINNYVENSQELDALIVYMGLQFVLSECSIFNFLLEESENN